MCECGERHDEYEYRIGYQYKDGSVGHTQPIEERETEARLIFWKEHNGWLLLTGPWLEKRKILKWQRVTA